MNVLTSILAMATPDWNSIEATIVLKNQAQLKDNELHLQTSDGVLCISLCDFGMRIKSQNQRDYDYGLLLEQPVKQTITFTQHNDESCIESRTQSLKIRHSPFSFELMDKAQNRVIHSSDDGHFVRRHRVPPLARVENGWVFSVALASDEAIYGLGEKWGSLNKRGQLVRSYNVDALGVNAEVSYKNTPFCWSPDGWGILTHTPAPVTHAVGEPNWSQRSYCAFIEDEILDVLIFNASAMKTSPNTDHADNNGAKIIESYTQLTGRAPMPPLWSAGVILSKAYYQDPEELLEVAQQVRDKEMPCDVITIDGRAWQDTQTRFAFEWDVSRYPDPGAVIDKLKELDFKVCIWEYPLISVEHDWFEMFAGKGWLLKDRRTDAAYRYKWDQQAFGKVLTPLPDSGIVDFTHPDAYAFWREAHKPLFELGIDMIKADFGEQLEDDNMVAHNGENGHALHNVYALLYNQCVFEAAEKYGPSGPFLFSRAAWTGSQRFNSQWGGDPQADWEGMMANIRGGISWGTSGAPFYATDVGGFYKDTRDDALYVRWAQAAVFSAHFRLHGIGPREPWSYSSEANAAATEALQLRYQLLPVIQEAMRNAVETGLPVQRPMVLAFPQERQAWGFENQFMFGKDLLVAPCFSPHGTVEFYLPTGSWARFAPNKGHDKTLYQGGRCYTLELALDEIAVFARPDAMIPLCNKQLQHTSQLKNKVDDAATGSQTWTCPNN